MEILKLVEVGIPAAASAAAGVLRGGGIVLYPTDTLYGLGVDATNSEAISRLIAIKGREEGKPISILVANIEAASPYAHVTDTSREFAKKRLPGALTLVLPSKNSLPSEISQNGLVGIRISAHPFAAALTALFGRPITATSANRAGENPPPFPRDILLPFGSAMKDIALVIDDGPAQSIPSTVISFASDTPQILREGAVSRISLGL